MAVWGLGLKKEWPEAGKDGLLGRSNGPSWCSISTSLWGRAVCGLDHSSSARTLPSIGQCARRKGRSRPMDDRMQSCKRASVQVCKCAGIMVQRRVPVIRCSASLQSMKATACTNITLHAPPADRGHLLRYDRRRLLQATNATSFTATLNR